MSNAQLTSLLLRGELVHQQVTDPAAGSDFGVQFPNFMRQEILYVAFRFITSAAVANRNVTLCFRDGGGTIIWRSTPVVAQTAGQTRYYYASAANGPNTIIYPLALQIALPPLNVLGPFYQLGSVIDAIDIGDQLALITINRLQHGEPG